MPTNIDGTQITGVTVDGQTISEITIDGTVVFSAGSGTAQLLESFESGDIAEYSGNTGAFSAVADSGLSFTAPDGSYVLEATASSSGVDYAIGQTATTVSQGDTLTWNTRTTNFDIWQTLLFGVGSASSPLQNCYRVSLRSGPGLSIDKMSGGSYTNLNSTGSALSLSTDTTYTCEVDWATDGTITLSIMDQSGSTIKSISTTDTEFTSGGYGWHTYTGGTTGVSYADNLNRK